MKSRAEEGEYHFCYYPIPERNEALQIRLKRSSNCTAFKTWEACFAFMEWIWTTRRHSAESECWSLVLEAVCAGRCSSALCGTVR